MGLGRPQDLAEKSEPLLGRPASPGSGVKGASESSGPWTWAGPRGLYAGCLCINSAPQPLELTYGRGAQVAVALRSPWRWCCLELFGRAERGAQQRACGVEPQLPGTRAHQLPRFPGRA